MDITTLLDRIGIVPVIKLNHPDQDAAPLSDALLAGGLPIAEITFRAEGADRAISIMKNRHPEMAVGAGTVLDEAQVERAVNAGADFIVTPGMDPELVRACRKLSIPIIPGCTTPTDYHTAYRLGLKVLKFFPAEQSGGLAKIKAMSAPFPMFRIIPTGGISADNLEKYLSCHTVLACGGSYMVKDSDIEEHRWELISRLCAEAVELAKEAKQRG